MIAVVIADSGENLDLPKGNSDYYVISTSGLNFRSQPSLSASILTKIPYGTLVPSINEEVKLDTIEIGHSKPLAGQWLKVSYKSFKGYLFDAYLIKKDRQPFPTRRINEDYALLYTSCSCIRNFQYTQELNWFGIFSEGDTITVESVKPTYHVQEGIMEKEYCITTDNKEEPEFIIGTRLSQLKVNKGMTRDIYAGLVPDLSDPINEDMFYEASGSLIYCYNNRDIDFTMTDHPAQDIVWRGDLNGDTLEDFIIEYGHKESQLVLKMSVVRNGRLEYDNVAAFYGGYCC